MEQLIYLVAAEWRAWRRNGLAVALGLSLFALIALAAWLGTQRITMLEAERAAAAAADREIWVNQGEDNPHAAAHFSRYAFKPVPALAVFDPGVLDTAGAAIWMEGHYQNPAQFRLIEDAAIGGVTARTSPAFVIVVFGTLLVFVLLAGAVAGEREDGTLRQVLVSGVAPARLAGAKLLAALVLSGVVLIATLVVAAAFSAGTSAAPLPDAGLRVLGLIVIYGLYFVIVAGVALGISARLADRRGALGALAGLWAGAIIAGPLLANETALGLAPNPDGPSTYAKIVAASNSYFRDEAARREALDKALAEYGVAEKSALPFRYDGYELQYSEEVAHPKFEAVYSDVRAVYMDQERILGLFSIFLPNLAVQKLSAGLAGTDRLHHAAFAMEAEAHRRHIVKLLNDDLAFSALETEGRYVAGRALWETIPDFQMTPPRVDAFLPSYLPALGLLTVQALLALWFARTGLAAATRGDS